VIKPKHLRHMSAELIPLRCRATGRTPRPCFAGGHSHQLPWLRQGRRARAVAGTGEAEGPDHRRSGGAPAGVFIARESGRAWRPKREALHRQLPPRRPSPDDAAAAGPTGNPWVDQRLEDSSGVRLAIRAQGCGWMQSKARYRLIPTRWRWPIRPPMAGGGSSRWTASSRRTSRGARRTRWPPGRR